MRYVCFSVVSTAIPSTSPVAAVEPRVKWESISVNKRVDLHTIAQPTHVLLFPM